MNIQVITDNKKPLLKRRELSAKLGYDDKTPSRLEIRKEVAKKLGVKEELVVVKRIKPAYGTSAAELEVSVYDDDKSLKKLEDKYMVNRHLPKEKKEKKVKEEKKEETTEPKKSSESVAKLQKPKEEKKEGEGEKVPEEKKEEGKEEPTAETESKKDSEPSKTEPLSAKGKPLSISAKLKEPKKEEVKEEKK